MVRWRCGGMAKVRGGTGPGHGGAAALGGWERHDERRKEAGET